ncbi:hypothetical protein F5146DRAFT_1005487 [Armillaria mellea]|nr:hypothetical protein F5146DRAFT_1005487 [Armillaria mellea]
MLFRTVSLAIKITVLQDAFSDITQTWYSIQINYEAFSANVDIDHATASLSFTSTVCQVLQNLLAISDSFDRKLLAALLAKDKRVQVTPEVGQETGDAPYNDATTQFPFHMSPNTWKVRYALNYKGIPYHMEWVEYPDIEGLYKSFGMQASATKKDCMTPYYTLPVLHDPSIGAIISESAAIVEYFGVTYPDTPQLIPPGTRALHTAFTAAFESQMKVIGPFLTPAVNVILSPRSQVFHRKTREESSGVPIEDMILWGEHTTSQLVLVKDDLGKVDKWMMKRHTFVMGETPTFVDFTMSGWIFFLWIRLREDSPE